MLFSVSIAERPTSARLVGPWTRDLRASGARVLRILHVIPRMRLDVGGPVRAVTDLCTALASRGHGVSVATCDDRDCPASWRGGTPGSGVPGIVRYEAGSLPAGLFSPAQLARMMRAMDGFDAVHFHNVWLPGLLQLAPGAAHVGTPLVVSLRGMLDVWSMARRGFKKRVHLALAGRRILRDAGWVHCTAARELEQSRRWMPGARAMVIPNLLDLGPFVEPPHPRLARRAFSIPDDGVPTLLFLSRLIENKGVETLIRAASILARRRVAFRLVIAGTGEASYTARMRALVWELGLGDRVQFVGMVTGELKLSLMCAARLMVLPTVQENFGFVFFESMACGTPVLTSRVFDTAPELESSGGAALVDLDPESFAHAAGALLASPGWLDAMAVAGRRWTFEFLRSGPLIGRYEEMYRSAHERHTLAPEPTPYCPG